MAGRAYFFLRASRGCLAEPKVLSLLRADGRRGPKNSLHFAWPAAQPAVCPLARQPAGHSKIFSELRAASRLTGQPATPGPASRTCFICFSWFLSWLFFLFSGTSYASLSWWPISQGLQPPTGDLSSQKRGGGNPFAQKNILVVISRY